MKVKVIDKNFKESNHSNQNVDNITGQGPKLLSSLITLKYFDIVITTTLSKSIPSTLETKVMISITTLYLAKNIVTDTVNN